MSFATDSANAKLSDLNRRFLEAVEDDSRLLERRTFASVHADNPFSSLIPLQSWPTFVNQKAIAELERVSVGLGKLLKAVPERLFGNDPARIASFYGFDNPELVYIALYEPNGIDSAMSRCDLVDTREGLKCLEFNCGSYLGGWFTQALEPLFRACPAISSFLDGQEEVGHRNTIGMMFDHMVSDTIRRGIWQRGDFNLALVLYPHDSKQLSLYQPELYRREYRGVLSRRVPQLNGNLFICSFADLRENAGVLYHGGEPVHALLEQQVGLTEPFVFRSFKAGRLNLFSGPITQLLSDKRNIGLLSERSGSDVFSREERELIERHLPWTRVVRQGEVVFRGSRMPMEELLARHRTELVLKYSRSAGGKEVFVGRFVALEVWSAVAGRALGESGWIVQEYVKSLDFRYQHGERGAPPHEVVWGPWDFGGRYGGTLLRMLPSDREGLVNTANGAEVGIVLEVDETERG